MTSPPPTPRKVLTRAEWELYLYCLRVGDTTVGACHRYRLETRPDLHYMITYTQLGRAAEKGWLMSWYAEDTLLYYRALPLRDGLRWLIDEFLVSLTPPRRHLAVLRRAIAEATDYLHELSEEPPPGSPPS